MVKELQQFLGFCNCYRRFIQNYSVITTPLHLSFEVSSKTCFFSIAAHVAFQELKKINKIMAPLLKMPDSERQFFIEMDALEGGVEEALSQKYLDCLKCLKSHPCAFSLKS